MPLRAPEGGLPPVSEALVQAVNREMAEVLARFQWPQPVPARGGA
ncbi:MAG TPA: hypothetical protein VFF02_16595 [Anaeromyxobacteraceae bacterium]|nr:hypothetical protein [Anaeromyxobacteraceae bacterium]